VQKTPTYTRSGGKLRVSFQSFSSDALGFTLEELDALEVAITHARSRLLEKASKPTLSVLSPPDADLQSRFHEQLRHMQPVPT
jgi:hypothetical protein